MVKGDLDHFFHEYGFDASKFGAVKLTPRQARHKLSPGVVGQLKKLPSCQIYADRLPISTNIKRDLLQLCQNGSILSMYECYFQTTVPLSRVGNITRLDFPTPGKPGLGNNAF